MDDSFKAKESLAKKREAEQAARELTKKQEKIKSLDKKATIEKTAAAGLAASGDPRDARHAVGMAGKARKVENEKEELESDIDGLEEEKKSLEEEADRLNREADAADEAA